MDLLFYISTYIFVIYLFSQFTMVCVSLKRLLVLRPVKSADFDKCDTFIWIFVDLWD